MKVVVLLSILFAIVLAQSNVLDLDSTNFHNTIKDSDLILVEFYAPWCGHCKRLAPEYEKAADELKGIVPIARINADEESNRPIGTEYGIRGFPTLKIFRNKGEIVSDYEGERSAEGIVTFMKRQTRPAVVTLTTEEEVNAFTKEDKVTIVGFFNAENADFKQVAETLRNKHAFGAVIGNKNLAKSFGLDSDEGVILFKTFDEGKNLLPASQISELSSFINKYSVPLIDEIGAENYKLYAESGLPLVYLFVDPNVEGQKDNIVNYVTDIAKEAKGKLNFVTIDWSKYARHSETLGLSGKTVPVVAIEEMKEGLHYAFDETKEITKEGLTEWINSYLNKQLQPTIKSEEIPETNDEPVKIVVAKTFDQIVNDPTKNVLVEFYAPWCGHCKKLAPIYEELATSFKDQPNVVIAKIDATANDISRSLNVRGFPTLKLFPANNKTPIDYNGDRSLVDLTNFINTNAGIKSTEETVKDEL